MRDIHKKPSKWKAGCFPAERILTIALHQKEFSVHQYQYRDDKKRKLAGRLEKEGFLKRIGKSYGYIDYAITEAGKSRLKEIQGGSND